MSIFNIGAKLSDVTITTAAGIIIIYGLIIPFRNIPYIMIVGIFRSGGDTMTGMKYDLFCVWCIALPLTAIAAFVFKLLPCSLPYHGVWRGLCEVHFMHTQVQVTQMDNAPSPSKAKRNWKHKCCLTNSAIT